MVKRMFCHRDNFFSKTKIGLALTLRTYPLHMVQSLIKDRRVVHRVTASDNAWQRVKESENECYNEWQRVTKNGNEWQRVRVVVQRMKTAQYTSKNGWLASFQWQKEIHYYLKEWMAATRLVK